MTIGLLSFANSNLYEGFVATRARVLNSSDTTNKQLMVRSAHIATENLTSIKVVFSHFVNGTPDSGVGASTTQTASIEYPSGTIAAQLLFGGSTSVVTADASTSTSDYASVSIPAGATFWIRRYCTGTGGICFNGQNQSSTLAEQTATAISGLSDQTMSTSAISGGTSQTWTSPPLAIIGRTTNASVLIIGDSRTSGSGDGGESNNFDAKVGNIARSMGSVPFVNIGCPSSKATSWATDATARNVLLPYGSQVIVALGINDMDNAAKTAAQTVAGIQAVWASAAAPKKYAITIEPHTSGSWSTLPAQTNVSTNRVAFNTLVRAGISGATGFYEVADVSESSRNSTLWVVSPSPPYTGDGLHENSVGYALLAASGAIVPAAYP